MSTVPLFTPTRSAQRYLGDAETKTVHDLLREKPECGALDIIAAGRGERFVPDRLEFALTIGYRACPHCLPEYAEHTTPAPASTERADKQAGTGIAKQDG